ncbi:MAG: aldose 1-epimerase family protein [Oscillospiraceae bacterium]|nr:aldose 1-epimerase family protein [Oscillospiraceae bacterium]
MIYEIKNDSLTVRVEDEGAQLASIRDERGIEYLWQGDKDVWARRAPLLFPVIARLKDRQYTLDGKTWSISIHGFCRNAPFVMTEQTGESISFRYTDTEETRKVYPFPFALTVTYQLEGRSLRKVHRVENTGEATMYYELGGHDGYRAPLEAGEKMADYGIRFPDMKAVTPFGMDAEKMITPKTVTFDLPDGRLSLKPSDYGLDTVILDKLPVRRAVLTDGKDRPRVTVDFADFPYLGIWTIDKPFDTGYVCIEPWTSLPDAVFVGRDLREKAGIRSLEPGQSETLSFTTTIHAVQ